MLPSKLADTFTSFISSPWAAIFFSQMSKASLSRFLFCSTVRRSLSVAIRSIGLRGLTMAESSTSWFPSVQVANSGPWAVSTITWSPIFTWLPFGLK